jgi:RNA polymerase sigma-70 factor, ECF subfamily
LDDHNDVRLLDAVGRGDADAFERIYLRYKDDLFSALVGFLAGDRATAEDVLHDVFVTFAERARRLRIKQSLRNYLWTSCLNRARDVLRRRTERTPPVLELATVPSETDPRRLAQDDEEARQLWSALGTLPLEQREVVLLHIHGQLTFREVAELLGISINTAQSRYRYALQALRKRLNPQGLPREREQ